MSAPVHRFVRRSVGLEVDGMAGESWGRRSSLSFRSSISSGDRSGLSTRIVCVGCGFIFGSNGSTNSGLHSAILRRECQTRRAGAIHRRAERRAIWNDQVGSRWIFAERFGRRQTRWELPPNVEARVFVGYDERLL